MKLSDIFEADVVDFAAKRKEKEFIDKVGAMQDANRDDDTMLDLAPKEDKLFVDVQRKYGQNVRDMNAFLKRPVMSGGFKSAHGLNDALQRWKRGGAPEKVRRAIQRAALDDSLYNEIQKHYSLWHEINNRYPMEVIFALPNVDDFEVLEDLSNNLADARKHFIGK